MGTQKKNAQSAQLTHGLVWVAGLVQQKLLSSRSSVYSAIFLLMVVIIIDGNQMLREFQHEQALNSSILIPIPMFYIPIYTLPNEYQYFYQPFWNQTPNPFPFLQAPPQGLKNEIIEERSIQPPIQRLQRLIQTKPVPEEEINPHLTLSGNLKMSEGRNILPNNVNILLSFLRRKSKSQKLVSRVIQREEVLQCSYSQGDWNSRKFYSYQRHIKFETDKHVHRGTLREVTNFFDPTLSAFKPEEQLFYNKVARICLSFYLLNQARQTTLSGKRLIKTRVIDHLRVQRQLKLSLTSDWPSS